MDASPCGVATSSECGERRDRFTGDADDARLHGSRAFAAKDLVVQIGEPPLGHPRSIACRGRPTTWSTTSRAARSGRPRPPSRRRSRGRPVRDAARTTGDRPCPCETAARRARPVRTTRARSPRRRACPTRPARRREPRSPRRGRAETTATAGPGPRSRSRAHRLRPMPGSARPWPVPERSGPAWRARSARARRHGAPGPAARRRGATRAPRRRPSTTRARRSGADGPALLA
jgi:hypothetical protein